MPKTSVIQSPGSTVGRDELSCPLCGYSLRGLVDPRCPECGFAFSWQELIDAVKDRHPYLFEHGSGRSLVPFFKTLWFTNLPWKFWTDLHPAMRVHPKRLCLYWLIATSLFLGVLAVAVIHVVATLELRNRGIRFPSPSSPRGSGLLSLVMSPADLRANYPLWSEIRFVPAVCQEAFADHGRKTIPGLSLSELDLVGVPIFLVWPIATLATLLIFFASMRKAKIKPMQVVRTVVYSCDFGLLLILFGTAIDDDVLFAPLGQRVLLIMLACVGFMTFRMTFAFSRYLRVHRPVATVIAVQSIVFLLMFVVVMCGFGYADQLFL